MSEKISIFVLSHKETLSLPKGDFYKPLLLNDINVEQDSLFNLRHSYSEGAGIHYVWKNAELPEYIGFCHYRRFFDFNFKIDNIDAVFEQYDAILPNFNLGWPSVYDQYNNSHNINDFLHVIDIIKKKYPEYYESAKFVSGHDLLYPCNMFVIRREMFNKYCQFVFGVLETFDKEMGFNSDLDVYNHVVNNISLYSKEGANPTQYTYYQARIQAFLMERLSTIFFNKEIKNPMLLDILITELKYKDDNVWFKYQDNKNIKVALCMIGRLENKYIREYVSYYKEKDFDKIFIYDNNRPEDGEKFIDELEDYVKTGFVEIIDWPIFVGNAQKPAYQDCFDKHKHEYDWIAFFDADEYFTSKDNITIKQLLNNSLYDRAGGIALQMINYDDNDVIVNNKKTRLDVYTRRLSPLGNFYKTIVKCEDNDIDFSSSISDGCHIPYTLTKNKFIYDIYGDKIEWNHIGCNGKEKNIFLKHIPTGCIDDYIHMKDIRKWPDTNNQMVFGLQYFSTYNKLTEEKINYYNKHKITK